MKTRYVALLIVLLLAVALTGCQTKVVTTGGAAPLYTVTAGGTGETVAAPDMAEMYFGASVQSADANDALQQASALAEEITAAVKSAGVEPDDIQTANVSVYPQQNMQGDRIVVTGYQASIQVRAKIRDISTVGDVISAASEAGANEIGGPSFTLSEDSEAQNEALERAIEDARARAEVMAEAAGKSLGEIISVSEANASVPMYLDTRVAAEAAGVPIEPGQLEVSAQVTVVFELK